MAMLPGAIDGSGQMASKAAGAARTWNWLIERMDAGVAPAELDGYARPALRYTAPASGVTPEGWFCGGGPVWDVFAQDGRAFAVSGASFVELNTDHSVTVHGTVDTGIPATMSSSGAQGDQLFITAGGNGYIFTLSTNVFAQIVDAEAPDFFVQGVYMNAAFVALGGDGRVYVSANLDGTSWNALDSGFVSDFSDQVIAIMKSHDNLILCGTQNSQPWTNVGVGGIAGFEPVPGALIEHGTAAAYASEPIDNTTIFVGRDVQGQAMVWRMDGYTPVRISTHAVEADLMRVSDFTYARAWSFQLRGHTCYVLYVPGLAVSWVYDVSVGVWVEWGHGDLRYGVTVPFRGVCHAFGFGVHLVGDRSSGTVYEMTMAYGQDRIA